MQPLYKQGNNICLQGYTVWDIIWSGHTVESLNLSKQSRPGLQSGDFFFPI